MATELETLVADAACWGCVSTRKQLEVQTYIIAYTSGLGTDPDTLSNLARGLDGLSFERLSAVLGYLLGQFNADVAGGSADAQEIIDENPCYACLSNQQALNLQTYMLSLDARGPTPRDPDSLVDLAKCFCGLSMKRLLMIQIYLLATNAGISTDPESLDTGATSGGFVAVPPHVLQTQVYVPVTVNIEYHWVGGIGPITTSPCDPPNNIPTIYDEVYGTNGAGQDNTLLYFTVTAGCRCADRQLYLYGSNNADGSDATLIDTIAFSAGALIVNVASPHPDYLYVFMTQDCAGAESLASNILPMIDPVAVAAIVTDWDARVQTNGGAALGVPTIDAALLTIQYLMAKDLWALIYDLNLFAPDSLIASITPIKVTYGLDPWTNHNFLAADLNAYGLKGNGSNKWLQTGVTPVELTHTDMSVFAMCDEPDSYATIGSIEVGSGNGNPAYGISFWTPATGTTGPFVRAFLAYQGGAGDLPLDRTAGTGYALATRSATTSAQVYFANRWNTHFLGFNQTSLTADPVNNNEFYVFATNNTGSPLSYSYKRMKAVGFGSTFTQQNSSDMYNALVIFREGVEGGAQTHGENWATRVARNGGAAPAASSVTAIDNFCNALEAAGILNKMMAVVAIAPDNTIAARTPIYRAMGFDPWDYFPSELALDVNGMSNGGNKLSGTGCYPGYPWTNTGPFAGLSVYCYESVQSSGAFFGTDIGGAQSLIIFTDATNLYFDFSNNGNDRVSFAHGNKNGFYSGSRTVANAAAGYFANSTNAFAQKATNTNVMNGVPSKIHMGYGWAYNNGGAQYGPNRRLSFIALHYGLTAAETEDLYDAVQALRTALGGGFV